MDQLAQARLVFAPHLAEVAVEGHVHLVRVRVRVMALGLGLGLELGIVRRSRVHRMVHEAPLGVLDGQYALHPEDVLS